MKKIHVAAAIICKGNAILAAQRGYGDLKGGWEFPGGKVEDGETAMDACIREIREELHITISDLTFLCTVEHDYEAFHLSMDCFTCSMPPEHILDTEHEGMRWLNRSQIWDVAWLPADVKVVNEILDHHVLTSEE